MQCWHVKPEWSRWRRGEKWGLWEWFICRMTNTRAIWIDPGWGEKAEPRCGILVGTWWTFCGNEVFMGNLEDNSEDSELFIGGVAILGIWFLCSSRLSPVAMEILRVYLVLYILHSLYIHIFSSYSYIFPIFVPNI